MAYREIRTRWKNERARSRVCGPDRARPSRNPTRMLMSTSGGRVKGGGGGGGGRV